MKTMVFQSKLLPNGYLYCPQEIVQKKNAHFKVIVTFDEESGLEASEHDIEQASMHDLSDDFLTEEEVNYYLSLK